MKLAIQSLLTILLSSLSTLHANFGDQAYGWSATESEDFRDYAVRALNRQGQLINDYHLAYWLEQSFLTLNLNSQSPIGPTLLLPINDDRINAFAMPGNLIGINAGLFLAAGDEAELASVIAHEMAHIGLDHFSRIRQDSQQQALTIAGGILLSILLAGENPEAANATLLSSLAISRQEQLSFSRAMETEADQLAQQIMTRAEMDPDAGRRFFRRLDELTASSGQLEFLRSHPLGNTRAANLDGQSGARPAPVETRSAEFELLRLKLNSSLTKSQREARQRELLSELPQETIQAMPGLRLMQAQSRTHDNKDRYVKELSEIIRLFPAFLPAHIETLRVSEGQHCDQLGQVLKLTDTRHVTLDALNILNRAARRCEHPQQSQLHAKKLWQSGREEAALQFLKNELKSVQDTAASARLNNLLEQYNRRYARFN